MFAAEIRKNRVAHMRGYPQWRWHLDEVFVKVNGKLCYLWRAVDHEGEVLEAVVTAKRDKAAALKFLKRIMKTYGRPQKIVTDGLRAYSAAMEEIGNADRQQVGRRLNIARRIRISRFAKNSELNRRNWGCRRIGCRLRLNLRLCGGRRDPHSLHARR